MPSVNFLHQLSFFPFPPLMLVGFSNFNCRRRLEKRIYIPLPNFESRKELIKINLRTVEVSGQCSYYLDVILWTKSLFSLFLTWFLYLINQEIAFGHHYCWLIALLSVFLHKLVLPFNLRFLIKQQLSCSVQFRTTKFVFLVLNKSHAHWFLLVDQSLLV